MKRIISILLSALQVFALVACSSNATSSSDQPNPSSSKIESSSETVETSQPNSNVASEPQSDEFKPLEVKEYNYFMVYDYLYCAVILTNPNEQYAVEFPTFRVTAYDADNKVMGTDEQVLKIIYPNQDFAYAGQFFDLSALPAKVEIQVLNPKEYNIISTNSLDLEHPSYEQMTGINVSFDDTDVMGEISNPNDYDVDSAIVTVLFRNDKGELISGDTTFIDQIPAKGKTPFEISLSKYVEMTESYEVTANPW